MSFLTPIPALVAAAVAVPLLLLLYFLKLRRQPLMMASTLLWRKSIEDLEVNAPFQRLRWSWLLLLQLLLLTCLLLAMAQPVLEVDSAGRSDRVILIIDRSGSMNAADAPAPAAGGDSEPIARLAAAKSAAREIVERLGRGGGRRQVMIISAGRFAEVVSGFESRRQVLFDAIDSIAPTDEQIELQAAFDLTGAFAGRDEAAEQPPPEVVLISDGRVDQPDDAEGFSLQAREFRFLKVGPTDAAADNIGIVAFSARRRFDDPAAVQVFARLLNAGTQLVTTAVTLRVDDQAFETRTIDVPAAGAEGPGEASVTFELQSAGAALLSLVQSRRDPLAADDAAAMVLRPPPSLRVALVYPDPKPGDGADPGAQAAREAASGVGPDPFLAELIQAMQPAAFQAMTRSSYRAINPQEIDFGALYDLVIFDRVGGEAVPGIPSISFGAAPAGIDVIAPSRPGGTRVLSWDRQHPIMQQLSLDSLVFSGFGGLRLPADATPLAFGPDGPIIAVLNTRGSRHVIVGFELMKSNWPTHVSIAVFMQNAVDYLTLSGRDDAGLTFRPGEPITVRAVPEATRIRIDGPLQGEIEAMPGAPGAPMTLPPLRLVGVYRIGGAAAPMDRVAVSMLSAVESDLRPRAELIVNARPARAGGGATAAPLELWPWLAAIALGLLIVEWLVYLMRRRV